MSSVCIRDTGDRDDERRGTWTESHSSVSLLSRCLLVSKDIYFTTLFIKSMVRRLNTCYYYRVEEKSHCAQRWSSSVRNPSTTFSHVTSNIQSCSKYESSVIPRGSGTAFKINQLFQSPSFNTFQKLGCKSFQQPINDIVCS